MKWEPVTDQMKDYFESFEDRPKQQVKSFAEKVFHDQRFEEIEHIGDCAADENCENRFLCLMLELQLQGLYEKQSQRISERYVRRMKFGNDIGQIKHEMIMETSNRASELSEPGGMDYINALEEAARLLQEAEDVLYKVS